MNKTQLKAIVAAAANEKQVRYFLRGAFVDFDNQTMAATDGHILIEVKGIKFTEGSSGNCVIPRTVLEAALKLAKASDNIEIGDKEITVGGFGIPYSPMVITQGDNYPQYKRVIPADAEPESSGYFAWYQSKYIKAVEDLEKAFGSQFLWHLPNSRLKAIKGVLEPSTDDDLKVTVALMPTRVSIQNEKE